MDYTSNNNTQGMRQSMGPVGQPNWNGGPRLNHNPQVMNNQAVGQPNLANAMANQRPIIPIRQETLLTMIMPITVLCMMKWSKCRWMQKIRQSLASRLLLTNWSLRHLSVLRTSILLISYVRLLFLHLLYRIHMRITGLDATVDQLITVAAN